MSAIHRIDNMWEMEAGRFYRFAQRLPAYKGAMRAKAERVAHNDEKRKEAQGLAGREIVPVAAGELAKIPGLSGAAADGLIQFG
jgi:hypothetical protein